MKTLKEYTDSKKVVSEGPDLSPDILKHQAAVERGVLLEIVELLEDRIREFQDDAHHRKVEWLQARGTAKEKRLEKAWMGSEASVKAYQKALEAIKRLK